MVIVMQKHTDETNIERVTAELIRRGFDVHRSTGSDQTILGVIGPSGSGKTTLIRMLTGTLEPTQGKLTVLGQNPRKFTRHVREKLGYMPQHFVLYDELTAAENVSFVASLFGLLWPKRGRRVNQMLKLVELWDGFVNCPSEHDGLKNRLTLVARRQSKVFQTNRGSISWHLEPFPLASSKKTRTAENRGNRERLQPHSLLSLSPPVPLLRGANAQASWRFTFSGVVYRLRQLADEDGHHRRTRRRNASQRARQIKAFAIGLAR